MGGIGGRYGLILKCAGVRQERPSFVGEERRGRDGSYETSKSPDSRSRGECLRREWTPYGDRNG